LVYWIDKKILLILVLGKYEADVYKLAARLANETGLEYSKKKSWIKSVNEPRSRTDKSLFDLLHKSVASRHDQILCHGFHEFTRIFLYESAKICEIRG